MDTALAHTEAGSGGPPLLVLHGFMGSARSMAELVDAMSADRRVVAVDLIGHGQSPAPDEVAPYATAAMVGQVRALLGSLELEQVDVVGYSMGARLALSVAVALPELVDRLVLIGGTAGIGDQADRKRRVSADAALADDIERDGMAAFVDRWEALPLFASQLTLPRAVRAAVREGRLAQRELGMANSLRGFGTGSMAPLWDHLGAIAAPTLAIAGERDAKYTALALRIEAAMANARAQIIPAVGHATHTEAPEYTARAIRAHLQR